MPELSRFYGIVIKMFFDEHPPPHFHAEYGDQKVVVDLNTLAVITGKLSPRAMGLVIEWATLHQAELRDNWDRARNTQSLNKIAPLS
jgi:hypothetical protein